ncbi:MAG: hypothetical protein EBY16_09435, partial [Gammaproteobacteria bacterium]|nr:hypothetical protein [Gammaproteobacteria bacterium]
EHHAASAVDILVTRTLSEDEWGLFLNEAQQHEDLKLQISCVPGVILPDALANQLPAAPLTIPAWDKAHHAHTICIVADDPDLAISHLCKAHKDCMVFNISECSPSDLLIRIDGKLNDLEFVFSQKEQALLSALREGKTVVLTGSFSDELLDGLAVFIRQRTAGGPALGQLILLSQKPIGFMEAVALEATVEEKHQALVAQGYSEAALANLIKDNPSCMKTESFCSLITRLNFLGQHPDTSSQHAWDGLGTLRPAVQIKVFDPKSSKDDATAYLKRRLDAFHQVIANQPYVFLAGLTGVGKSRFVENELGDRTIFFGENAILAWIKSKDKNPSLFLDEANLSPRQWSEFEGLFNTPPSILIDGTYHVLTPAHKVIFAGNPLSYGDERKLAPLFARHGNSIVFEPLSNAFIYEKTLKPILEDMFSSKQCGQIAQELLDVYDFLIGISKDEVLISPRQIQMMALAVIEYHQRFPEANIIDIAKFQARHLAAPLVPKQHLERFNDMFPAIDRSTMLHGDEAVKPKFKKFLATPSRDNALWQLTDFLSLRRFQRETESDNPQLCLGGLHRFVIEGEPGIGKSEMAVELMVGMGLHELRLKDKHPAKNSNGFYRLFASMPPKVQEEILLTAFDEGAIVLIDEINSMPTLEKLLNSLLDGKHTNEDNRPPHVPGFRVLGTQNPPTMAGRRLASPALANRTQTVHLSAYPKEEMEQILEKMGWLSADTKTELVAAFQHQVNKAQTQHLSPAPSFRDFIKTAEQVIEGHVKARMARIVRSLSFSEKEMVQILQKMKGLSPTISAQLIAAFEQEATKSRPLRDVNDMMKPVLERHFNTRMHTVVQETLLAYFEARANPQTRKEFIAFIHEVEQIEKEGVTVIWASIKDEVATQMFDEFS